VNHKGAERIWGEEGLSLYRRHWDKWEYENKVVLEFSSPGKPTYNAYIKSFNTSF
jgi:putative transposase